MYNLLLLTTLLPISMPEYIYVWGDQWILPGRQRESNQHIDWQFSNPTYTFTFSSPLTGIPELGYGIKNYEADDYLGEEKF